MLGFLIRRARVLVAGGVVLATLGLLVSSGDEAGRVGRSIGLVGAPAQALVRGLVSAVGSVVDRYVWLVGAREEAERLRRELVDLRRELASVEEVFQENERLRDLLAFRAGSSLRLVAARVVGRSATPWLRTAVIDKGTGDGVSLDAPVLTPAGVVGRVYQVSASASRVLLITDPNSAVDALVQRTRAQVVVEGNLGPVCRVLYLSRGEEVAVGDRVVTSGLGGVFPKGLYLGQVSRVEARPGEVFQRVELRPGAELTRLEEVLVALPAEGARP